MEAVEVSLLDVKPMATLAEREEIITKALDYSDKLRWRAFAELRHIQKTKQYLEARNEDGTPAYPTWETYIAALEERLVNTSRRTIFQRTSILKKLNEGLQVPLDTIAELGPVKLEAITKLGSWDRKGNLLSKEKGSAVTAEKMKEIIVESADWRTGDTIAMVDEMLGIEKILFYGTKEPTTNGAIPVEIRIVESTGVLHYLKGSVSQAVAQELSKRLELSWEESP